MEYRRVGKSGLKVSALGLGCGSATFAGRVDEQTCVSIIHHALALGINYVDTAETYAEGRSETLLGKALRGRRSEVIISCKFGHERSVGASEETGSRSRTMKAIDGSLKRLNTDYIDIYVMHQSNPRTPIEETLRTLDDLVRAGKVRYIGCSNFPSWRLCEALWTSRTHNLESFITAEGQYSLVNRKIEGNLVPCCETYGVGVIPTSPLARGFLTGKYRRGHQAPAGSRFADAPDFAAAKLQDLNRYDKILSAANFDTLAKLERFSEERGHSVGDLAIAWLLSHSWLGSVPVGVTSAEQLTLNVAGADWKLSADDIGELEKLIQ